MHLIILPSFIIVLNLVALITRLISDSKFNTWLALLNIVLIVLGVYLLIENMKTYQRKVLSNPTKNKESH